MPQLSSAAYLNIQTFNAEKASVYLISAPSSTPGAVYNFQYRLNGGTWTSIGTPSATRNPTFTLPAGPGSYEFQVYVTATWRLHRKRSNTYCRQRFLSDPGSGTGLSERTVL